MSSSSSTPHRSYAPKSSNRYQNQQRYVPKTSAAASNSNKASKDNYTSAVPLLTTSLRTSSSSASKESRPSGENFINYLPQDEAVASGLGADAGGLDAIESQGVVDVLNEQLSSLLKMSPRDFWREVSRNDSLHDFLDSYLQFRHRWYDFPPRGAKDVVAGVIIGEVELCRRVFMVLYRMSSNRDPGVSASECLSIKDHTVLLQEKKLLDLPKLLDICAIYGHENGELTRSLVTNAIKAQPYLLGNLSAAVSHFLSIVHTMHERCISSVEVLISSAGQDHGHEKLRQDFLEVMDFINDAIVTLDAFADAYKPAALYFCVSFDMSYGSEELLNTLAKLHDNLLPSLQQGIALISKGGAPQSSSSVLQNVSLSLKMLSMRIVNLGWKLINFCYLSDEPIEDSLLQSTTKMFPAIVEDTAIRGDIIIQTFKEIKGEVLYQLQENTISGSFIQNLEKNHKILSQIGSLRDRGWIFMYEDQFQYLTQIAAPPYTQTYEKAPTQPISSHSQNSTTVDEEAVILESKISQIKDIFPDYGKGFLSACLDVYNHNPEEVIQRILEGTLHNDLLFLDTSLEHVPPPKPSSSVSSHNKNDKGKGLLVMESAPHSTSAALPARETPMVSVGGEQKGLSSSTPSSYGRFTRKSNEVKVDSKVLDSKSEAVRSAVLAAELEYEDEYDDSFDELGLTVVESSYEETENSFRKNHFESESDSSSRNSRPKWGSQKTPQFYVKDGKNYSYKVAGSVPVHDVHEAAVVNQAEKDTIHGLGRGGNIPSGAVKMKMMMDGEEEDEQSSGEAEAFGRGAPASRGRGGGRRGGGGRNHNRKNRAMKKHFSGLGGF